MTSERKVVVITGASRGINTIPGMPCMNHDQYDIDGIRVERFTTAPKDAAQRPPLICVHGGCHASWSWQEHAAVYAAAGYEVHALNWRGRGGSAAINDDSFVNMSIADVVDDIDKVDAASIRHRSSSPIPWAGLLHSSTRRSTRSAHLCC